MSTGDSENSPTNESSSTNCPPILLPLPLGRLNYPVARKKITPCFCPLTDYSHTGWKGSYRLGCGCRRARDRLDCGWWRALDMLWCSCRGANDQLGCGRSHNMYQVVHCRHIPTHLGHMLLHIVATRDFTVWRDSVLVRDVVSFLDYRWRHASWRPPRWWSGWNRTPWCGGRSQACRRGSRTGPNRNDGRAARRRHEIRNRDGRNDRRWRYDRRRAVGENLCWRRAGWFGHRTRGRGWRGSSRCRSKIVGAPTKFDISSNLAGTRRFRPLILLLLNSVGKMYTL